jgi:PAS domain S-box-containing protein
MNRTAQLILEHERPAWAIAIIATLVAALGAAYLARDLRENERITQLHMEAARQGVELISQTINGSLMGSVAILGLLEEDIKRDAQGEGAVNTPEILGTLESITRAYAAQGVFVVGTDGVIRSSWDSSNKPSTGLKVQFRPYFKMAMQGKENVYAAVSLARGDRALYFSAPIYAKARRSEQTIGAVVARTDMTKIDAMLHDKGSKDDKGDIALLLSPQGVVFASSRAEWIGHLAGQPSPERLQAIRELKQFGNLFESKTPAILPLALSDGHSVLQGRRFAVASTPVAWNDPSGDWRLVLLEDLSRTVPLDFAVRVAAGVSVLLLLLLLILFRLLRSHYGQRLAALQVESYARAQEYGAERKSQLAAAALRLQQARSVEELAQVFLTEAHHQLGALQGVIYLATEDAATGNMATGEATHALRLAGGYACATDVPATLALGEGLLGQCARERMTRLLETPLENSWSIGSGLGHSRPAALLMAPILLQDKLLGVLELATLKVPNAETQQQFDDLVGLLGMNIEIVRRSQRTEELLSNTVAAERAQAEQLSFQQALIDTIPYPVFYKDADTRFLGLNRAYEECFGVQRETLIGKRALDLDYLPEADRLAYPAEDEAAVASAASIKREMQIAFADGKQHDTLYYVSGFHRADGSPGGLVGTFIDISDIKQAQNELARLSDAERFNRLAKGREARILDLKQEINGLCQRLAEPPRYASALLEDEMLSPSPEGSGEAIEQESPVTGHIPSLAELVDLDELQRLFTAFCESVGIAAAIIDLDAQVLASSRWQRACTDFHRVNPDSCARCIESDTQLALKLADGQDFTMYRCKNGMTDCASPIIVEGHHLANVFIGQFHLGPPDMEFFRQQARQFSYAEAEYLQAIEEAPVADEKRLPVILGFLSGFARMISTMSLARHRADLAQQRLQQQAQQLHREQIAALSLAEDAEQARMALAALSKESLA